jgi:glycerol-3-phosphate dehydrogenase (NAD(P)+)
VESAGAISNVSALASGMADALELGETAQGMLLARGLAEAQRLGLALGAEPQTFAGAAGVGDLIPRRVTSTDRHREVGARVARGEDLDAVLAATGGPVEGVVTAKAALPEVARLKLKLPLIEGVARILTGEGDPRATLEALLQLDLDDLVTAARRA